MKTFTIGIVVLFFGISCNGFPSEHHDPSEAEFEKEFHVKHNNPEQEAKAAEELAKEEIEIDYQNDLYDAGKALRRLRLQELGFRLTTLLLLIFCLHSL